MFTTLKAVRVLAVVGFAVGCSLDGYPKEVTSAYLRACTANGFTSASCSCMLKKIRANYPYDDFVAFAQEVDPAAFPAEYVKALSQAQALMGTNGARAVRSFSTLDRSVAGADQHASALREIRTTRTRALSEMRNLALTGGIGPEIDGAAMSIIKFSLANGFESQSEAGRFGLNLEEFVGECQ